MTHHLMEPLKLDDSFSRSEVFIPRGKPLPDMGQSIGQAEFYHSRVEWSMFFASIYSLQEHPGMSKGNVTPKTIPECAKLADQMLAEYIDRLKGGVR